MSYSVEQSSYCDLLKLSLFDSKICSHKTNTSSGPFPTARGRGGWPPSGWSVLSPPFFLHFEKFDSFFRRRYGRPHAGRLAQSSVETDGGPAGNSPVGLDSRQMDGFGSAPGIRAQAQVGTVPEPLRGREVSVRLPCHGRRAGPLSPFFFWF